MAMLLGMLIGGWLLGTIIISLADRFSSSLREQEPLHRSLIGAAVAFVLIYMLAGLGFADGRGFAPLAGLFYIPGIAIAWFLHHRKLKKAWAPGDSETFS